MRSWMGRSGLVILGVLAVGCSSSGPTPGLEEGDTLLTGGDPRLSAMAVDLSATLTPIDGASSVAPGSPITVQFGATVDRSSAEQALSLFAGTYDPSKNPATFTKLALTSMCDGYWRVRNPNAFPMSFTWDVYNSPEKGLGVVPSSADTFFYSSRGNRTVRVFVGSAQQAVKAQNPAVCSTSRALTWNNASTQLTLNPAPALQNGSSYTAVLSTGVFSTSNNRLSNPLSSRFKSGASQASNLVGLDPLWGNPVGTLTQLSSLAWNSSGSRAVLAGDKVLVMDRSGRGLAEQPTPSQGAVLSPDGNHVYSAGSNSGWSNACSCLTDVFPSTVWNLSTNTLLDVSQVNTPGLTSHLSFSPDGTAVTAVKEVPEEENSIHLSLVDSRNGNVIRTLGQGKRYGTPRALLYSPQGDKVAGALWTYESLDGIMVNGTAAIWDAATGAELLRINTRWTAYEAAWSPNQSQLALLTYYDYNANSRQVQIVNTTNGGLNFSIPLVRAMSWSPTGNQLAVIKGYINSASYSVDIVDAVNGNVVKSIPNSSATLVKWAADGTLAVGMTDGSVRLLSGPEFNVSALYGGYLQKEGRYPRGRHTGNTYGVAWSPDGQQIASASREGVVKLWDAALGYVKTDLETRNQAVYGVAFSPDGTRLASAGSDNRLRVRTLSSGETLEGLGHSYTVRGLAWSPDGQTLATASWDNSAKLWDAASLKVRFTLPHSDYVNAVVFSPDGTRVATASSDQTVTLWNAATGQKISTLSGHTDSVFAVAWSPDGQTVASGAADGSIRLWTPSSGQVRLQLSGHTGSVRALAFAPDGRTLLSGGVDRSLKAWNPTTGDALFSVSSAHQNTVFSLAVSKDGRKLVSSSADGEVKSWTLRYTP